MGRVASAAGTTLMVTSAVIASSLIWLAATDPLRSGTYAKTLTFTLSTTNP